MINCDVDGARLWRAVKILAKVSDKRTKKSANTYCDVEIRMRDTALYLTVKNAHGRAHAAIPAAGDSGGTGCLYVDCHALEFALRGAKARISLRDSGGTLAIVVGKTTKTLPLQCSNAWSPSTDQQGNLGSGDSTQLLDAINSVVYAACADANRPHMYGILLETSGDNLTVVAVDGHRLAASTIACQFPPTTPDRSTVIPYRMIPAIQAALKLDDEYSVALLHPRLSISVADVTIVATLSDASFPPYRQVIPHNQDYIDVNRAEILALIPSMMVGKKDLRVCLSADNGLLAIRGGALGEPYAVSTEIPCKNSKPLKVALSPKYFLEMIKNSPEDKRFRFYPGGELDPVRVGDSHVSTYSAVLMPMRMYD